MDRRSITGFQIMRGTLTAARAEKQKREVPEEAARLYKEFKRIADSRKEEQADNE